METFLLAFIPIFVAIDPIGTLPLFLGMAEGFTAAEKRKLAYQAVGTACAVGVCFGTAGHFVFRMLGITPADFRIAGGLLLLMFSFREIFGQTNKAAEGQTPDNFIGMVPLGVPVIAGPAMITTLLILHDEHSYLTVLLALVANMLVTLLLLLQAERMLRVVGEATSKVFAKIVAIFLAAIGIMMIRKGLELVITGNWLK